MSDIAFNDVLENIDSFSYEEKISLMEALKKSMRKVETSFSIFRTREGNLSKKQIRQLEALKAFTGLVPNNIDYDEARTEAILK